MIVKSSDVDCLRENNTLKNEKLEDLPEITRRDVCVF